MDIFKTKFSKVCEKITKKPILEIGIKVEIQKLMEIKNKAGAKSIDEIFDGLMKQIKKECNC